MTTFVYGTTVISAAFLNSVARVIEDVKITRYLALTPTIDTIPYFTGTSTQALTSLTSFGRQVISAATADALRTTAGLGTAAVADARAALRTAACAAAAAYGCPMVSTHCCSARA